jgi:hypothetical protein
VHREVLQLMSGCAQFSNECLNTHCTRAFCAVRRLGADDAACSPQLANGAHFQSWCTCICTSDINDCSNLTISPSQDGSTEPKQHAISGEFVMMFGASQSGDENFHQYKGQDTKACGESLAACRLAPQVAPRKPGIFVEKNQQFLRTAR